MLVLVLHVQHEKEHQAHQARQGRPALGQMEVTAIFDADDQHERDAHEEQQEPSGPEQAAALPFECFEVFGHVPSRNGAGLPGSAPRWAFRPGMVIGLGRLDPEESRGRAGRRRAAINADAAHPQAPLSQDDP